MLAGRLSRQHIFIRTLRCTLSRNTSSGSNTVAHKPAPWSTSHEPRDHPPSKPIHVSSPRHDAPKHGGSTSLDGFTPFSQIVIENPIAQAHYERLERKFVGIVRWVEKSCLEAKRHAHGVVDLKLVESMKITPPTFNEEKRIDELGTISVVDEGTALLITLFDKRNLSSVEKVVTEPNHLRGAKCEKTDSHSLKIFVPLPSQEQRHAIYHNETGKAEHGRREIREDYKVALKKGEYARNTQEYEAFMNLEKHYTHKIDSLMHDLKQEIDAGPNRRGAGPQEDT